MAGPATRPRSGRGRGWRSGFVALAALVAIALTLGSTACSGDDSDDDDSDDDRYEGLDDIDGSTMVTPFADVALQLYDEAGTSRTDDPATGIEARS